MGATKAEAMGRRARTAAVFMMMLAAVHNSKTGCETRERLHPEKACEAKIRGPLWGLREELEIPPATARTFLSVCISLTTQSSNQM
jgi:hypothetical protein